jgi:hypothetical protein
MYNGGHDTCIRRKDGNGLKEGKVDSHLLMENPVVVSMTHVYMKRHPSSIHEGVEKLITVSMTPLYTKGHPSCIHEEGTSQP